jgi:hypothetical protein
MSIQEDFRKKNKLVNVKALFDLAMGVIYAVVGAVLAVSKLVGLKIAFISPDVVTFFGIGAFLYGAFRIFRGIKTFKNPS